MEVEQVGPKPVLIGDACIAVGNVLLCHNTHPSLMSDLFSVLVGVAAFLDSLITVSPGEMFVLTPSLLLEAVSFSLSIIHSIKTLQRPPCPSNYR